jgi:phosphopantothenoylcysteine decarboxylase/phosphopantothenate--cysteine ligase
MGYAVARAAVDRGHDVTLVSGPVGVEAPHAVELISVETAAEMLKAVKEGFAASDALVMTAAVADWRPSNPETRKVKKHEAVTRINLERTEDILASLTGQKGERLIVGFAAETENVVGEGERKLREKNMDLVVANDVSREDIGFDADDNQVTFITHDAPPDSLPQMSKDELGERIVAWVEAHA